MAHLEEITVGTSVKGVLPDGLVTAVAVEWIGSVAINITYRDSSGKLGSELLYRDREPTLEVAAMGQPWSFDGDGALFRLMSEAHRIRLAYLFDPLLVYWFAVNWNFGPRALGSTEAHPAKNFVASCHEGLSLWRQNRSGDRSGAKECFAPTPVSAPGAALGSHLCVALFSVQVV